MSVEKETDTLLSSERLLFYDEIREFNMDNEFLLSGYRTTSYVWAKSIGSVFEWHNETINMHSHLIGSVVFALLPIHFYFTLYRHIEVAQAIDAVLFIVYFFGVSICFACSATCHVVWNHSPYAARFGNRLDYCGIVLLMWSASLASIHFAFICDPWLRSLHWLFVSASGLGCVFFTLHPKFSNPAFRELRTTMYASLGLFAATFILHSIYLYGYAEQRKRLSLGWMLLMAVSNLVGAAFYALRWPEIRHPYKFDLVGASHQLFHGFIFLAGLIHYKGLAVAFVEVRGTAHTC
ncbi:mPR-typeG-protein-coupled receptor [Myriangium duriaei CBS 260.36]|uniref:MPR-typeG-protein-coupled receptor n=1 Tax=Myriangium duriaei CBS 260.36 TaxID=1168546 RepID=A0A9P4IZI2_9PEZI|nr:mPR-typeG-protein-coupled receptor [Myriangium duriaei CBS 260.36]